MYSKLDIVRERYHVAKLALFNTRLLSTIQGSQSEEICNLVASEAKQNGFSSTPPLLHQGTFMSMAYICLVWVWESAKQAGLEKDFVKKFKETAERFEFKLPDSKKISGPRQLKNWDDVLKLARNGLSHGRVEINDHFFVLSDQNKRGKNRETSPTSIKLTWEELERFEPD